MHFSLALLALLPAAAQATHSPWARSKSGHTRHARAVNTTTLAPKFKYQAAAVNTSSVEAVASTWFAGWHGEEDAFPPENLTWSKYTAVAYAFAVTTPAISDLNVTADDDPILRKVVTLGHQNNVSVTIAIGGWTGSQYFSSAVATPENRTLFINAINKLVSYYSLDGVNFDWEYPNNQGIGCNTISSNDTANFLSLLKELRASPQLAPNAILTAAVGLTPFAGPDGSPSTDVSEFAQYLDHIEIMNYDVWGSWSATAGPNAPLNDTCVADASTQAVGSAVSAVQAWTDAGLPAHQIVLAVGSYGHSFAVTKDAAFASSAASNATTTSTLSTFPAFDAAKQPDGDKWQDPAGVDICGNQEPAGGNFDFWGLVEGGFLTENGTAAAGIDYSYDSCSQTPSVYNATSGVFVAYDDARSFEAKGEYIVTAGLKGFAMWEAAGDYKDILLDAIRSGAGFEAADGGDDDNCPAPPASGSGAPASTKASSGGYTNQLNPTGTKAVVATTAVANAIKNTHTASAASPTASSSGGSGDDEDEEDCDDDDEVASTTVSASAAATPTASAAPEDDDDEEDCDDEDESSSVVPISSTAAGSASAHPATSTSLAPVTAASGTVSASAASPTASGTDDDDEDCEDEDDDQ